MLTQVNINSIDVSTKIISYEYERAYGDFISQIEIFANRLISSSVTLQAGQTITIYRGWTLPTEEKIFDGYVESYSVDGGQIKIIGKDKLWDLVRKEVTHIYDSTIDSSAGKISAIFEDLVTTYGSLSTTASTIQDSGTAVLLQKFVCNHTDPFERCKKLSEMLDWQFYYRADTNYVYFEPKGYPINSQVLNVGTEIMQIPKWQYDITEMTNDVTIVGAYQEVETTKSGQIGVTSGFLTTSIALDYEPISIKVYGDAANPPTTLKIGGVPDSTGTYDYYVDKPQKKVYPKGGTTFTTNHYYEIRYSFATPIPINMYDETSITSYGRFKKTITYKDLRSVADAEQRGINYLAKYAVPFIYSTIKVKNTSTYGLAIGQKIRIVDAKSVPSVDSWLVINKLRIRYPSDYDELDVGDRYWRLADFQSNILEKLKRMEEDEFSNQDILNNLITTDNRTGNPVSIQNRYKKIQTNTVSGVNVFILGNSSYGILGTNQLGDAGVGADTDSCIMQYANTYTETFYDDDFKSGSTTATWDNGNKWLSFTSGQIGQSTSIDYNNGTITTATLTATISSGTFTLQLSADGGSHWENTTNGAAHTFTYTGTNLMWKITEAAASTGKITQIVINSYH